MHLLIYTCTLVCVPPLSLHVWVSVHTCAHVFLHHHLLMQSAIMCTAPSICCAWLLWKSRLLTLASLLLTCLVSRHCNYSLSVFSVALAAIPLLESALCYSPVWLLYGSLLLTSHLTLESLYCLHLSGFLESLLCCVHL